METQSRDKSPLITRPLQEVIEKENQTFLKEISQIFAGTCFREYKRSKETLLVLSTIMITISSHVNLVGLGSFSTFQALKVLHKFDFKPLMLINFRK